LTGWLARGGATPPSRSGRGVARLCSLLAAESPLSLSSCKRLGKPAGPFKVAVTGRAGVGKSALISALNRPVPQPQLAETPGLARAEPSVLACRLRRAATAAATAPEEPPLLCHLQFWEAGDSASRSFETLRNELRLACDCVLFVFSVADRASLSAHSCGRRLEGSPPCGLLVRPGLDQPEAQVVSRAELLQLGRDCRLRLVRFSPDMPSESAWQLLTRLCECLWHRRLVLLGSIETSVPGARGNPAALDLRQLTCEAPSSHQLEWINTDSQCLLKFATQSGRSNQRLPLATQQMQHRQLLAACLAAATAALCCSPAPPLLSVRTRMDTPSSLMCYKWFSEPNYWFQAEQTCLSHRAQLASIKSEQENRLVGRLSHCRDALDRFVRHDLDRLADPTSYRWTDGRSQPLIRSDVVLNSLYHERHPFVCKLSANSAGLSKPMSSGWWLHDKQCYVMPQFEANFNEANFTASETRRSWRRFGIDSCESAELLDSVWLGLIKLNPCFLTVWVASSATSGRIFSGKHDNKLPHGRLDTRQCGLDCELRHAVSWSTAQRQVPQQAQVRVQTEASADSTLTGRHLCTWEAYLCTDGGVTSAPDGEASPLHLTEASPPQPDGGVTSAPDGGVTSAPDEGVTPHLDGGVTSAPDGGVTLHTDGRRHVSAPDGGVTSAPDGGVTPPVDGLVAAFDFRRGLDNLVDPRTFAIEDQFGVERVGRGRGLLQAEFQCQLQGVLQCRSSRGIQ
uniref:C-type lectin domain-containing protein n=1 Tax=Macrostomum lignano TaxID=282301 RepID=A0A1I8FEQ1_9PLAT